MGTTSRAYGVRTVVARTSPEAAAATFSGSCVPPRLARLEAGGGPATIERGHAGDVLVRRGPSAWWVAADGAEVRAGRDDGPDAERFELDTVLSVAALAAGAEALHAGCVAVGGRAVAIAGGTGGGKTTLVAALVASGATLVADDVTALGRDAAGRLVAHPAPPLLSLDAGGPVALDGRAERVARLGGEDWLRVREPATAAVPLALVAVLDRREDAEVGVAPLERAAATLLALLLDSGREPERLRGRFLLAADVAAEVPVVRLTADTSTPPSVLTSVILDALPVA